MTFDYLTDKRVALLLSGGVDSAVALHLLVKDGISPDCFYIKIGPEEDAEWDCSSEEDVEMATAVAARYGCRFEIIDCHKEYWSRVTTYTMDAVRQGRTPNPDVMCNRLIKFGAFDEKCGHLYDYIATGHYCRTEMIGGRKWLTTSPDPVKDQTDFLAQIYDWQLQKAVFPIGHLLKDEVRRIAESEHLVNARRKDSQGICFLGKINYNEYLRRYLGQSTGDIVEWESGKVLGQHSGHWFHTIGQRKGLRLGGGPWNVIRKDVQRNIVYVTRGYAPVKVHCMDFRLGPLHLLTPGAMPPIATREMIPPVSEQMPMRMMKPEGGFLGNSAAEPSDRYRVVSFKIRHTPDIFYGMLLPDADNCFRMEADRLVQGVAPGQFCVVYDREHHRCYGSAEIIESGDGL